MMLSIRPRAIPVIKIVILQSAANLKDFLKAPTTQKIDKAIYRPIIARKILARFALLTSIS